MSVNGRHQTSDIIDVNSVVSGRNYDILTSIIAQFLTSWPLPDISRFCSPCRGFACGVGVLVAILGFCSLGRGFACRVGVLVAVLGFCSLGRGFARRVGVFFLTLLFTLVVHSLPC